MQKEIEPSPTQGKLIYTDVEYKSGRIERTRTLLTAGVVLIFLNSLIWVIWGIATNENVMVKLNLVFAFVTIVIFGFRSKLSYRALAHTILVLTYTYTLVVIIFFEGIVRNQPAIDQLWFIAIAIASWILLDVENNPADKAYANMYVVISLLTFALIDVSPIDIPPIDPQPPEHKASAHALTKLMFFIFLLAFTQIFLRDIRAAQKFLGRANNRLEDLVKNMLPEAISNRLRAEGRTFAVSHPDASVLFADLVGFTPLSTTLEPIELVNLLDDLFTRFDNLTQELGLEKIKTIGDAYMVAAGLPEARANHAEALVDLALRFRAEVSRYSELDIRIGINSGEVVAGLIGQSRLVYDLWGDTVNIASRLESHGETNEIQISETTYHLIKNSYDCVGRGEIELKGRGKISTYFVTGRKISRQDSRA